MGSCLMGSMPRLHITTMVVSAYVQAALADAFPSLDVPAPEHVEELCICVIAHSGFLARVDFHALRFPEYFPLDRRAFL